MRGFFSGSRIHSKPPPSVIMQCGACGLYKTCKSPKMPYSGKGLRRVLIVAEAPGSEEDERGIQLIGRAGQELQKHLRAIGVDMRRDCWLENSIICRPPDNRTPKSEELAYCRPHLVETIDRLKPDVIVPLGGPAVQSLIRSFWKEDVGPVTKWVGWRIPCQRLNAWICPTYHPSFLLRSARKEFNGKMNPVLSRMFRGHLKGAFGLDGRPFEDGQIPNYDKQVRVLLDDKEAAHWIRRVIKQGGRVSFDYEGTALKPEMGEIVCCSVCWEGKKTIAFPWQGQAIKAMGELLKSRLPKIGWNIKFEDRWTRKEFGHRVRNWIWDGMVATHAIDSRRGICSAKFQAFVNLGMDSYNDHIESFLKAKKGMKTNEVLEEVELSDLLVYCGIDSLVEYQIAMKQMEILK